MIIKFTLEIPNNLKIITESRTSVVNDSKAKINILKATILKQMKKVLNKKSLVQIIFVFIKNRW